MERGHAVYLTLTNRQEYDGGRSLAYACSLKSPVASSLVNCSLKSLVVSEFSEEADLPTTMSKQI